VEVDVYNITPVGPEILRHRGYTLGVHLAGAIGLGLVGISCPQLRLMCIGAGTDLLAEYDVI